MTATIKIPTPKFDQHEHVWLHFHGSTIPTRILVRRYDVDDEVWYYRVALSGQWHTASDLDHRTGEAA